MKVEKSVHLVMPRADATPDELRQLAAAKEMVEAFVEEGDFAGEEASVSLAAHFAHEFLWTHGRGDVARWRDFPVEDYFLQSVPSSGLYPPALASKLLTETCLLFCWLARSGRISRDEANALCARAEGCRREMMAAASATYSPELVAELTAVYEGEIPVLDGAAQRRTRSLRRRTRRRVN
jgi:hypothetical protein